MFCRLRDLTGLLIFFANSKFPFFLNTFEVYSQSRFVDFALSIFRKEHQIGFLKKDVLPFQDFDFDYKIRQKRKKAEVLVHLKDVP